MIVRTSTVIKAQLLTIDLKRYGTRNILNLSKLSIGIEYLQNIYITYELCYIPRVDDNAKKLSIVVVDIVLK